MTFIHSKTSAKTLHAGPGKNGGTSSGEMMRALSPETRPSSPTGWWEGSCPAGPRQAACKPLPPPRSRPSAPASAAACAEPSGPSHREATVGGPRREVSPPPARPQGRGRCQGDGACSPEGGSALSESGTSSPIGPPQPRHPRESERRRLSGRPPTHLRARATTPGGQRHPEPPQPLLPPPPETPLRKSDHWSEAATLPDMVPPSSPSTSPFPHASQPSRSNCGTEVRLPRSDNAFGSRAQWCPLSSVPLEKKASEHWFLVSRRLELDPSLKYKEGTITHTPAVLYQPPKLQQQKKQRLH